MQLLNANPFAMHYETSMKKTDNTQATDVWCHSLRRDERSQALVITDLNAVMEKIGVDRRRNEEESVVGVVVEG